jgi:TolA-binding protein
VSASPADVHRLRSERELLEIARQLPVPVLSDARQEELRTALLASVGAGSAGHVRSRSPRRTRGLAAQGRQRLLLVAAILLAGAGIAAAAWRIKTRAAPPHEPVEVAAPPSGGRTHGLGARRGSEKSPPLDASPVAAPDLAARAPLVIAPVEVRQTPSRPTRRLALTSAAAHASRANVELAFARGWSALRANDFEAAAQAFGQAAAERNDNALGEDAAFWKGVALARANHPTEAQEALTRFLVLYPRSDRAGEASVMVGWLLLRAGDVTAAEARFGGALGDPSERVRQSARAGLAASGRRHAD